MAVAAVLALTAPLVSSAHAQDFFQSLFGGWGQQPPASSSAREPSYPAPRVVREAPRQQGGGSEGSRRRASSGDDQAYCVRGCDGRYFPISGPDNESRAKLCKSFCPAAETKIVYGEDIEDAATENGKSYTDLPNAFRYRNELVSGCTCNGKDHFGLAAVKIDQDPTLRSGDIVAGPNGLVVANRSERRGVAVNFSPMPDKLRSSFRHVPVVAKE